MSFAFVLSLLQLASAQPEAQTSPAEFPEVVARVNTTDITKEDLLRRAEALRNQMPSFEAGPDFYQRVLADMVSGELLYQSVAGKGLVPSEQQVEAEIQAQKSRLSSEADFQKVLDSQGITIEELRVEMKKEIAIQNLIEKEIIPSVTVTEEEKKKFYDDNAARMTHPQQFRAAHILIGVGENPTPETKAEAQKKATAIHGMLEAGQDFAELARKNSDDPGSKDNGGELPWMSQGQTVPPFEAAALALSPGQLSGVVETQFGFHVIRLLEKREAGAMSYQEAEGRIDEFLKRRGLQQKIDAELEKLRAAAKVELFI